MGCNASKDFVVPDIVDKNKISNFSPNELQDTLQDIQDDADLNAAATKIQATFRGHKVRSSKKVHEQLKMAEQSVEEMDLNDPELSAAASKIQATFRGHQVRKEIVGSQNPEQAAENTTAPEEEVVDIDLKDPEVAKAASKIQMKFRSKKN